jgi:16S rRNA (guanine1207-N2)-methyltransferase
MTGEISLRAAIPRPDIQNYQVKLGNLQLEIFSLPGLPAWELSSPSARLIAEHALFSPPNQVLLFGCHQGALAAYLAQILPSGQLTITDHNFTALEATRLTLSANDVPQADIQTGIELPSEYDQKYNAVIIQIPKGRLLARRWLLQAYNALTMDGNLYLVGSNRAGIQSVIKDAQELIGLGRILAYKKGNRLAHFIKRSRAIPAPIWTSSPGVAAHTWIEFSITLADHTYIIRSLPGVFSFDHPDEGTCMLLDTVHIPPGVKVLDAGCGYGIIGLYAAVSGAGIVHLVDNNLLAVAACRETLSMNGIKNAEVYAGDLLSPVLKDKYDLILSNPPFHTGHAVDYQIAHALIENSYQALNLGGRMIIVANRFIRYDRLIQEVYGNITIVAESSKFHVLSGLKSS